MTLDEFEIKILRVCAGEAVPGIEWGAAMGACLETLRTAGLIDCVHYAYAATDAGHEYLKGIPND